MIDQGGGWYDVWSGDNSDAKGYRFINNGDMPLGDKFYVNYVFTYGKAEKHADWTDNTELFSGRSRPLSVDRDHEDRGRSRYLHQGNHDTSGTSYKDAGQKYTIAQAWSAGKRLLGSS